MNGIIVNFRGSHHTKYDNQMIVIPDSIESKEKAAGLVGKRAIWKSPAGKEIKGEIRSTHGCKGAVRVLFEKGMPGQSIGQKVVIE